MNKRMTASEMLPHSVSWLTHSWEVTAGGEGAHAWGEKPQICNILTNQPEFRKRQKDFIRSLEALKFDAFMMENTLWNERIYWSVHMPAHLRGDKEGGFILARVKLSVLVSLLIECVTDAAQNYLSLARDDVARKRFCRAGKLQLFLGGLTLLHMSDTVWNYFCVKTETGEITLKSTAKVLPAWLWGTISKKEEDATAQFWIYFNSL